MNPEINVLDILDQMDAFRRRHENDKSPSDWCMRCMEAILAKAAGYESRTDWTDALNADESTEYHRYLNPSQYQGGDHE